MGVFDGDALVHVGTPAAYVPEVMEDLFEWLRTTKTDPLIASCVFHCGFEFIHPFSGGNGRTGRLWHSLLLQKWNGLFEWLPVETLVAEHQFEYYDVLGSAQRDADCTGFVEFMLGVRQMDMYVRPYDDLKREEGDGPTLGIVLCAETDEDIARYSVLNGNDQLFAAKYKLYLPTEEQLQAEIEEQKRIFQAQQESNGMLPEGSDS